MTKALLKDTFRSIRKHFSRYISILLIIALGTCFFVGIKATSPDMFSSAHGYFRDCNLMDIRIQSQLGFTDADVAAISAVDGIDFVMGQKFTDAFVLVNGKTEADIDGTQITTRAYGFSPQKLSEYIKGANDGGYINRFQLLKGRYPTSVNECLVDESELSTPDSYQIGAVISLTDAGGTAAKDLNVSEFTIVGIIRTPYYLSYERGNTTIGSGKIGTFIYIPDDAFSNSYYSEIYATVENADIYDTYSEEYGSAVSEVTQRIDRISPKQIELRVSELRPQLEQEIITAQMKIENSSDEVKTAISEIDAKIETLQNLVTNGETMIAEAQDRFNASSSSASADFSNHSAEYNNAIREYSQKKIEYQEKNSEFFTKSNELTAAQKAYDSVYSQWQSATSQISSAKQTISNTKSLITAGEAVMTELVDIQISDTSNEQLQAIITMMQTTYPELYNSVKALTAAGLASEIAANLRPYLDEQKTLLAQQEALIEQKEAQLTELASALETYNAALEAAAAKLTAAKAELSEAERDLNEYYTEIVNGGYQLQTGELEMQVERMTAESQLNTLKENVASAPSNLAIAKEKREEIIENLDSGLLEAENSLQDAKELYSKLGTATWNIYTRDDTPGFSGFGQSVRNIEVLSNIFPIFFFVISSLVCLITMTRFIGEDRTLVGTYKALGYSSFSIILKYVLYALSACILGSALGIAVGIYIFPYAIDSAYSIIYTIPAIKYSIPADTCLIGFGISLVCTCAATAAALVKELTLNPSKLMRPKAPKAGKRIFLEKFTEIWKNLNFSSKVTARNLERNKSRAVMTILGVAGCTAMLLASLGMYDSIGAITENQYRRNPVSLYDFQVLFSVVQTPETYEFRKVADDSRVEDAMLFSMKSMTGTSVNSEKSSDVYLLVPHDNEKLNSFIDLRIRTSGRKLGLINTGVIITEKLADTLKISEGDTITLTDSNGKPCSMTVTGIAENYVFSYVFCPAAIYEQQFGTSPVFDYAMGKVLASYKTDNGNVQGTTKSLLTTDFTKARSITGISFTEETTESINRVADTLSIVILIFFVSALILAFIILYNISNINIIERNRELATLKVLGFIDSEVRSYVYRETVINSLLGIALGILLGKVLHRLLITFTAIDTVMYGVNISVSSYIMSVAIAVLIIVFVSLVLNRKLMKIDMISSLKSVE